MLDLTTMVLLLALTMPEENRSAGRSASDDKGVRPQTQCITPTPDGILITDDSIGGLPTDATFAYLRSACSQARDTLLLGESENSPGLVFSFPGLTAVALQHRLEIAEEEPPDVWAIRGDAWVLSNGLSAAATWAELRSAFGSPGGYAGMGDVRIRFCTKPGWSFVLDADPALVDYQDRIVDLDKIPATSRIVRLVLAVDSEYLRYWDCWQPRRSW